MKKVLTPPPRSQLLTYVPPRLRVRAGFPLFSDASVGLSKPCSDFFSSALLGVCMSLLRWASDLESTFVGIPNICFLPSPRFFHFIPPLHGCTASLLRPLSPSVIRRVTWHCPRPSSLLDLRCCLGKDFLWRHLPRPFSFCLFDPEIFYFFLSFPFLRCEQPR